MAVADDVVAYLNQCGFDAKQVGVEIVVLTDEGTVKLAVDDPTLTPDPVKPDWIAFLRWLASSGGQEASTIVDVVEKPWNYADWYAEFTVDFKLEAMR